MTINDGDMPVNHSIGLMPRAATPWPAFFVLATLAAPFAGAQQQQQQQARSAAADSDAGLEEVVVTARKREENLVDVPLSISAFSQEFIEKSGIERVDDLAQHTPGLSFRPAFGRVGTGQGGGSSNRPTMRGQSNITGIPNVGFFVDGVFVSGNVTSYQLDNLERVEVIRGPQAALYGRGTFAGAINFITRQPGEQLGGRVSVTAGNREHYEFSGYLNGPLVDERLKFEISGRYYDFGGDWVNRATGKRDGGEESSRNVGGKLFWQPTDALDFELNLGWSRDRDGTFAANFSGINCLPPTLIATTPTPRSATRRRGYFCGETSIADSFYSRYDIIRGLGLYAVDRETNRASLKANYSIGEWTLSSIAAYNAFSNQEGFDSGFEQGETTGRPVGLTAREDRRRDHSLEFRIDSPQEARLHGLAGAYLYREDDGRGYNYAFVLPMTGAIPVGSNLVTLTPTATRNDSAVKNWSVFGLLEYDFTDRLRMTAEARYQVDTIIFDALVTSATNALVEDEFRKFLPRATALYKLSEDWNVYANVARGNKPGGFNPIPADANAAAVQFITSNFQRFDEESAWTYELGVKGNNESRTLSMSASVYWIDWTQQQLTQTYIYTRDNAASPNNTSTAIVNAGETRIRGLEIDLNARPIDSLQLRLAYSLVDSEVLDFIDQEQEDIFDTDGRVGSFDLAGDTNGQTAGAQLPQSPKHQVLASATYSRPLNAQWEGYLRADYTFESKRYDQVHNLAHTGDSQIADFRLGLENEQWEVALFVNNAFDDDTPASLTRLTAFSRPIIIPSRVNPALTQSTFFRDVLVSYPRKRQYGLTATYRF